MGSLRTPHPAPEKGGAAKIASSYSVESPFQKVFSSEHSKEARVQNGRLSAPNIKKKKVALVPRGAGAGQFENQRRWCRSCSCRWVVPPLLVQPPFVSPSVPPSDPSLWTHSAMCSQMSLELDEEKLPLETAGAEHAAVCRQWQRGSMEVHRRCRTTSTAWRTRTRVGLSCSSCKRASGLTAFLWAAFEWELNPAAFLV